MKVVHALKRIELIDLDIKDLKKLEKSIKKNKSFTTPIYISIEKQINIMLDARIKLLGLKIENPPEDFIEAIKGTENEESKMPSKKKANEKKARTKKTKTETLDIPGEEFEDEITMLTQSQIDEKIGRIEKEKEQGEIEESEEEKALDDDNVKLLDIALEKGTLNKKEIEKEKKKVRFFKDNFPGGEY